MLTNLVRYSLVFSLIATVGCSGTQTSTDEVPPQVDPATNQEPLEVTKDELAKDAENIALVPSPVETQKALEAAGIDAKLADLINKRAFNAASEDKDAVAVQTGVVIADLLLTVKSAENKQLIEDLVKIRNGMRSLDGGDDIDSTIKTMQERIEADAVTRDELLKELDELSGALIPELEFNGKVRIVPLIEAGSWLEGSNLVARAVKNAKRPEAADQLLKQPAVVAYFQKYVKKQGQELAPASVTAKLEESLATLKGLADKNEPLTGEDIDTVIQVTDDVLSLL